MKVSLSSIRARSSAAMASRTVAGRATMMLAGLTVLLGACQRRTPGNDPTDSASMAATPAAHASLIGPTWTLVELEGQPAPSGAGNRPATIVIEGGAEPRAAGFAGCNRWSSGYTHTAPDTIRFSAPVSTKMACATGMDLEQRFLAMISAATGYSITDSSLVLLGDGGARARFVAR